MANATMVKYTDEQAVIKRLTELVTEADKLDPSVVVRQIALKLASAESVQELLDLGEGGGTSAADVAVRPFIITDTIRWQASTIKADGFNFPFFAIVPVTFLDDDSEEVVTCGGTNLVIAFLKLVDFGAVPSDQFIYQFRTIPTSSGFETHKLADGSLLPSAQSWLKKHKRSTEQPL